MENRTKIASAESIARQRFDGLGLIEIRRVASDVLLAGRRELIIEHAGREYRLRLTGNGKLILTA